MSPASPVDVQQISNQLRDHYHIEGLEDVRVIRDRHTSKFSGCGVAYLTFVEISRRLGFITFRNVNESRAFLEKNFPAIYLYGPNSTDDRGTKVRIAYSREREDRARARAEGDWTCPLVS